MAAARWGSPCNEDDGETLAYRNGAMNRVDIAWDGQRVTANRTGDVAAPRYEVRATVKLEIERGLRGCRRINADPEGTTAGGGQQTAYRENEER